MSYAMDETVRLPASCPSCNADLLDTFRRPTDQWYATFVQALKAIRSQPTAPGILKLEFLANDRQ